MSTFEVRIRKIDNVEIHPNADALDLAVIGGYRAVVKRNEFKPGDLALYIPTDSLFTDISIAERLGIAPYLTGKNRNRVKVVRLRGSLSEGIVVPINKLIKYILNISELQDVSYILNFPKEGDDWTEALKVEKYEEPIPIIMQGKVRPWPSFLCKYDVENIKKSESLNAMIPEEEVIGTEKMHGSNLAVSVDIENDFKVYVCSRNNALEEDDQNIYWKTAKKYGLIDRLMQFAVLHKDTAKYVSLHGELIGVQDMRYGYSNGDTGFYAFDIRINNEFVDYDRFNVICLRLDIPMVPVLYRGPFDYDKIHEIDHGQSLIYPGHIREGTVIRPVKERYDQIAGRVQFKFVSEDYLTRKGNTTEFH